MDPVRFGRALGFGARAAARTVVMAADAAAATTASSAGHNEPVSRMAPHVSVKAARTAAQVRQTTEGLARGGRQFGQAVWHPFVKLSGVLWLEVTGVFFGLFLATALASCWKLRGSLHESGAAHQRLLWSMAMAAVFGYFAVSSFVRAGRRQRGR